MKKFKFKGLGRVTRNQGFFSYELSTPDVNVKAKRMDGVFEVEMENGLIVKCKDGYLVQDEDGALHPIPVDEFHKKYKSVLGL